MPPIFNDENLYSRSRAQESASVDVGHNGVSKAQATDYSLQHVQYVNRLNETVVATWDLQEPTQRGENMVSQVKRKPHESIGSLGDRRKPVESRHFAPGGKYRAICKLFMGFENSSGVEYIGTGWLITRDLLVTAGHCLFDSNGGLLKYIKVYIGYEGPRDIAETRRGCQLRHGKVASLPAEYIKTIGTVHDVGFVQLAEPFDGVDFMRYQDTPDTPTKLFLGVVGYPGDIDGGDHMYEHWADTKVDIATNRYLTYEIDTTGGESGSPVLMSPNGMSGSAMLTAVGVHVAGGYPNQGSAIGSLGNTFEDYVAAFSMKRSRRPLVTNGNAGKIIPVKPLGANRSFEFMVIPPSTQASSSVLEGLSTYTSRPREMDTTSTRRWESNRRDHCFEAGEYDSFRRVENATGWKDANGYRDDSYRRIESSIGWHDTDGYRDDSFRRIEHAIGWKRADWDALNGSAPNKRPVAKALCTQMPESLRDDFFDQHKRESSVSPREALDAAKERLDTDRDVQTTFFIGISDQMPEDKKLLLWRMQESVQIWQAWASCVAETTVQQKIDQKQLSARQDGASAAQRCTYRSMIFDTLLRSSSWLHRTLDEQQSRTFRCSTLDLHARLIAEVVKGLAVPASILSRLEAAVEQIANGILTLSKTNSSQACQYWIMVTRYYYDGIGRITPSARIISFKTGATLNEHVAGKNKTSDVVMTMEFQQHDYSFVDAIFSHLKDSMSAELVGMGQKFLQKALTLDIEVPPM